MELKVFQEKKNKKTAMIVGMVSIVILLAVVFLYRTYSIYQEKQEFDVIKGSVPDQNYDVRFAFYLIDENGNKTSISTIPEGKEYEVGITCNNEATGVWDKEIWGPRITNLTNTRTKCNITFSKTIGPLKDYGISENIVTEGSGLYEVPHEDANIAYTTNTEKISNLKMTEYRYAGESPNNYVTFNDEVAGWRIIGLVNTPEGQRIKLIRDESIGNYSWDSSTSTAEYLYNNGFGINEWSQADIMNVLNSGAYYKRTSGTCYNGRYNVSTSCSFSNNGLKAATKIMVDTITWNTGAPANVQLTKEMYNKERGTHQKASSDAIHANDTVARTTSWKGQIGLMYPSDYGYATSGGQTTNRDACLDVVLKKWNEDNVSDCKNNDWIYKNEGQWFLTPEGVSSAFRVFALISSGAVNSSDNSMYAASYPGAIRPTLYLKSNVKVTEGFGTPKNPYILKAE